MSSPSKPYVDPARDAESNTALFLTIVCVVWGLAFTAAALRFYTKAVLVRSFGKDDVLMALSVLCSLGGLVAWIVACTNGSGRHQDTIKQPNLVVILEAQFFQSIVEASFAFGFLKISIAISLLRLSRGNWYKWILWSLIAFVCFYTLFAFITFLTFCQPIAGQWDRSIRPKCYNKELYRDFGLFNTSCNIVTDIAFATLPIPLIWSLQLQRRIRLYLIAILSGGYFAVALGIARAVFIIAFVHERDGTYYPWAPFFASLQLDIGIIAACAPTLRPLLGRALRLSGNLNHYREANYYRAGKALDRLPVSGSGNRGYLRQNTASGEFLEMAGKGGEKWATVNRGNTAFSASVNNNTTNNGGGEGHGHVPEMTGALALDSAAEKPRVSEEDVILPDPDDLDPEFKGIVKTTEFRVEK
ncbi:hypothetical protein B0T24DRAFT_677075 [Lasiosphaeria ovina]|uniref:Rhodopsin domain-containing protein n=1 Tax=Lasiosphaeria ovina TaxID=92902 RepID=A0AAE0NAK2_9PEZI|nr:hypothetical protein B0T24DRAFT_677075 [Lasiosphaeria ovina]